MGVLEVAARIVQLGGAPERARQVAELRAAFEARTGRFVPEDAWFEVRSRAFWSQAVTAARFGRAVEAELTEAERRWLGPLERAHRGLFRMTGRQTLVDAWSGAEFELTLVDELGTRAELDASVEGPAGGGAQLFDGWVVGVAGVDAPEPFCVALLPGPVFHPREATSPIEAVLRVARERDMTTFDALDALLRMERTLRSLSRVKAGYAYRAEALAPPSAADGFAPVRRAAKTPR
jgi:hypothetical protein